jgi:alpha-N-arabinofuranosidase
VRNYGGNRIFKIACGPSGGDYRWTEVLMREAGRYMNGLALHYYCGSGRKSRSATRFEEVDWFQLLKNALRMDELVSKHSEIMDKYDPQKRVALVVDEWGTWHEVEPGTNPGFLYQQNTLRDALVAGVTLNIFNQHCDRVKMANIAQTINVLQAMILTDKEKMIVTPTYHVFEMYTVHHDATLIPIELESQPYNFEQDKIPGLNASASKDKNGVLNISICNLNPNDDAFVSIELNGAKASKVIGRVLTHSDMRAHNTFENPDVVKPAVFENFKVNENLVEATIPSKSVVVLSINP